MPAACKWTKGVPCGCTGRLLNRAVASFGAPSLDVVEIPWNLGNHDLTNREILAFVLESAWQVGCLAVNIAKNKSAKRETFEISM